MHHARSRAALTPGAAAAPPAVPIPRPGRLRGAVRGQVRVLRHSLQAGPVRRSALPPGEEAQDTVDRFVVRPPGRTAAPGRLHSPEAHAHHPPGSARPDALDSPTAVRPRTGVARHARR
ncbi:hypothetical protein EKD16_18975 [Streptomonospora litoralis]|uniref:Uncharacterized protein n=1 Tax=Streptomonospora litoralis TaxID=2498135 RepID=A0A4P6Q4C8_9ACTN|nr:hypothetical protein EKD16_18975 [Streptomonospora litoralis]